MIIQLIDVRVLLNKRLQMLQVSFLCSNVRGSVSIIVLSIEVVARLDKHLKDIVPVLKPGSQMEGVVALLVCVVNVDALLRKDAHDVSMAAPGCDPERIQAVFVLLVYVNHLVFKHQSHERLTEKTKKNMTVMVRSEWPMTYLPLVAAIFSGKPCRPTKLIS